MTYRKIWKCGDPPVLIMLDLWEVFNTTNHGICLGCLWELRKLFCIGFASSWIDGASKYWWRRDKNVLDWSGGGCGGYGVLQIPFFFFKSWHLFCPLKIPQDSLSNHMNWSENSGSYRVRTAWGMGLLVYNPKDDSVQFVSQATV